MKVLSTYCLVYLFVSILLSGCSPGPEEDVIGENKADGPKHTVAFNWFEYQGRDSVFTEPLTDSQYQNPILAGFNPDPSITRRAGTFYIVNSSFAYWPGLPIYQSTDLVNWRLVGHGLTRQAQINLEGLEISRGIFAPTIRYHDGLFYLITTAVDAGGNFLMTAKDVAGPWSDPIFLPEVKGIDPDIFFDDDGRVYIAHNGEPEGEPQYNGHRAIWLWEYDPKHQRVIADSGRVIVDGGVDITTQPIWVEGPHIFKKDGWYYLSCAEGGTSFDHSQVIFRTRSLDQPFQPGPINPILTQRDLDPKRPFPITSTGHADMIELDDGQWWAVFLGVRTYDETQFNTGRETFLLPVTWRDGWPVILEQGKPVPYRVTKPKLLPTAKQPEILTGNFTWRDEFVEPNLRLAWSSLRAPYEPWASVAEQSGQLQLNAQDDGLGSLGNPAFLARRVQHIAFSAATQFELIPDSELTAGLAAFQNASHYLFFGVQHQDSGYHLTLWRAAGGGAEAIAQTEVSLSGPTITLGIEVDGGSANFYYLGNSQGDESKVFVATDVDARVLSTGMAGGFVGAHVGVHAVKAHD